MRLKSKTDIITNSSTEVFTVYQDDDLETAEKIINQVLDFLGTEKRCRDLFDLDFDFDEEEAREIWKEDHEEEPTVDDLREIARQDTESFLYDYTDLPCTFFCGVFPKPKDPEDPITKKVMKILDFCGQWSNLGTEISTWC